MGLFSDPPTGSDDLLVTDDRDTSSAAGRRDRPIEHQAPRTPRRVLVLALSVLTLMAGGFAALWMRGASSAPPPATGNLRIESVPDGAEVTIDGQSRATAPAVLTVGEGRHVVDFRGNGETKRMPVEVVAGGEALARAILFADGPPGTLHVRTLPPGAQVSVDGAARGLTPLFLDAITPGERTLLVQNAAGRVMQRVIIAPGASVSVTVPVSGWLAVSSALKLKVFDNGRLAGSSETGRLLVGSGRRRIEVANDEVAFREEHLVDVKPGELIELRIALPNGVLHLTSDRPADVLVDGAPAGRTPLTNLVMRVGLHELTVSNPAFGEQRYTVLVRFGANRLEVKFADLISSKTPRPTRR